MGVRPFGIWRRTMARTLRLSIVVSMLLAACATKRSGLDSESHFACNSDADCAAHDGYPVCEEHLCVATDAGKPATTSSGGDGSGAKGVGGSGAVSGAGGASGHGAAGAGGTSPTLPDAMPPPPPDTGLPDLCHQCTTSLSPQLSLDCYCRSHSCDRDLA